MSGQDEANRVPAVARALHILEQVAENWGGLTLSDLSRALGAPKSSVLNVCNALVAERLLNRDSHGRYSLGLRVAEFARAQINQAPKLSRIGVATQGSGNPFFLVEEQGIVEAANAKGIQTVVLNAGESLKRQNEYLRELGVGNVDVVLVDAIDSNGVRPGIHSLRRRGKIVIAMNTGATDCEASVATDNVQAGQMIGRYLTEYLPEHSQVAILGGKPVTAVSDRIIGFLSALRERGRLRVVDREDGDQTETGGYRAAKKVLARQPRLSAFFAINDPTAIGAASALRESGRNLIIASVDGSASAVKMIEDKHYLVATAAQDPRAIGEIAVEFAEQLFAGNGVHNRFYSLAPRLITHENVKSYRPWG